MARVAPPAARAQLSTLETEDLRLVYFSPAQSYLAPHVARCFENSFGFHRKLLEYKPSEKVTILLTDFADFGNAAATGFFHPIPLGGKSLVVFRFTGEGFVASTIEAIPLPDVSAITFFGEQIAEKHPVVRNWNVGSPASVPLHSLITGRGSYSSLKRMGLESVYPVVQGYKDFGAVGVRANFSDPLLLNRASLTASYTPDSDLAENERYHLRADFQRYDWKLGFQLNGADFYDLFGPQLGRLLPR